MRDHSDEGWDSKVGEDAAFECAYFNAFNAIVETNGSSKRAIEGIIFNPPQRVRDVYLRHRVVAPTEGTVPNFHEAFTQLHLGQLRTFIEGTSRD